MPPSQSRNVRVTFERPADTNDAFGGHTTAWTPVYRRWVEFRDHRGREFFQARQVQAELSGVVVAEWDKSLATVTTKHRITKGARVLNIRSIESHGERSKELVFLYDEDV